MRLNTGISVPVALTCVSLQFMDDIKLLSTIFKASAPPHPNHFSVHKLWTQQLIVQLGSFLLRIEQYKMKMYREMGLHSSGLSIWVLDRIEFSDSLTSFFCPSTNRFLVPNGKNTGCASEPVWTCDVDKKSVHLPGIAHKMSSLWLTHYRAPRNIAHKITFCFLAQ